LLWQNGHQYYTQKYKWSNYGRIQVQEEVFIFMVDIDNEDD